MNFKNWENTASKLLTSIIEKPSDNFHSVAVDVTPDEYGGYDVHITYLFKTYFKAKDSEMLYSFKPKVTQYLKEFLPELGNRVNVSQGASTVENYESVNKPWYESRKKKNIDESVLNILKDLNSQLITEASKKEILVNKLGFSEENAESLERVAGSLSVIIANKLIDYQLLVIKSWRPEANPTKQDAIDKLNSGNLKHLLPTVTQIMDWVRVGLNGNLGEYKNLDFKQLLEKSKEWHDSLGVSSGQINYEEKNPILIDFRNENGEGFYWVDLQTNYSNEECERMGHCGRTGQGNNLYSLREVRQLPGGKYTINKSHLTASIGDGTVLYQLKGSKNSKPKEEYHNYILPLFYYKDSDGDYIIDDFGNEYASEKDFKITDLPNNVIVNLYENRPELFSSRSLQRKLVKLGIIEGPEVDYNIKVTATPENLSRYVDGDYDYRKYKRKVKTPAGQEYERTETVTLFEIILSGDMWDLWNNYDADWKSSLNYHVDSENEKKIEEIIKSMASKDNPDFNEEEFNEMSLEEKIEEYDDHEIKGAISNATNSAESDSYGNYLYNTLKNALKELGTVEEFNDTGAVFYVDMEPYINELDSTYYDELMERCDDDLSCVFDEMIGEEIDKPDFSVDDRWYPDVSEDYFNEILSDNLSDIDYRLNK